MNGIIFSKTEFGNRIRSRRKECGFKSQAMLAEKMVPLCEDADEHERHIESKRKAISNWEYGNSEPSVSDFVLLCNLLNCDPDYLIGKINVPKREISDVMQVTQLTEAAVNNLSYFKTLSSKINEMFCLHNVFCISRLEEETPIHVISSVIEDQEVLQLLYLFFAVDDMDNSGMVKNTRSNAILIELIGILTNKRNSFKEFCSRKVGSDNG